VLLSSEEYHDLATLVRTKARKNSDRLAFRFAQGTFTFSEVDRASDRVAAGLAQHGIGKGDRVAALLFNCPEIVELWFGAAKLGAVMVPINNGLKGEILRYELADSDPKGIVLDHRLWGAYEPIRPATPGFQEWFADGPDGVPPLPKGVASFRDLRSTSPPPSVETPKPWEPAEIMYTSGTTGPPKGAIIPHQKLISTPYEIGLRSKLDERSVLFTALPLFHCNAQEMTALTAFLNDCPACFEERFHASTYWETAHSFRATHVSLLISMVTVLFKQPDKPTDATHGVRVALTAGATREVWPRFEDRFKVTIVELYGMTECGCTTTMNPPNAIRVGSIGTPLGFVEADVVDDDDRPVAAGVRGELVVRPRVPFSMFSGYLNKPQETIGSWRNLWFHTGDYVTKDPDGYYYFVDRKKDVIRRRGENLAPYDVESVLITHPSVFEAVVVGVPSPLGEEDVKAFVVLKPGESVTAKQLFEFAVEKLPFFMVPKYIEFLSEVPKTANQKAQRFVLRQRKGGEVFDRDQLGIVIKRS
jgi:acyl-CoA synthetase (AMP-forming)/AMP-acid ligase II